jgi:hypothetical protein
MMSLTFSDPRLASQASDADNRRNPDVVLMPLRRGLGPRARKPGLGKVFHAKHSFQSFAPKAPAKIPRFQPACLSVQGARRDM